MVEPLVSTPNPDITFPLVTPPEDQDDTTRSPAQILAANLNLCRERNGGVVRLLQFGHDSAGLRIYKARIGEALVYALERAGYVITKSDPKHVPQDN